MSTPRTPALLATALALILATLAPATTAPPAAADTLAAATDTRPNIVLISSDDQTDWEMQWMPHTRALLTDAGIDFTDGINPTPLCCPARTEILTGEYAHNNGVRSNGGPWGGYQAFLDNGHQGDHIGSWLQDAGYRTALIGKPLNGLREESPLMGGWDYYSPSVDKTYSYYGTRFLNDGEPRTYPNTYVADVVRDQTIDRIVDWSGEDAPFFIWASHVGPHGAIAPQGPEVADRAPVPAWRHIDTAAGVRLPTLDKPSYREINRKVRDKPVSVQRKSRIRPLQELFQRRVEALQGIDEANRDTINALKAAGEWDNTVVAYVSDNGYQMGEHGLQGKNYVYAENLQIPFIMRAPDMPEGTRTRMTASIVDLAPTFLDYAGALETVRGRGQTDGVSLSDAVREGGMANDTSLIQAGSQTKPWEWRGVRTSRYTWARHTTGEVEFYDRRVDPYEMTNLVDVKTGALPTSRYGATLIDLRARYRTLRGCAGVAQCEGRTFAPLAPPRRPAGR